VFVFSLIAAIAVQGWLWQVDTITDQGVWVQRMGNLVRDFSEGDLSFEQEDYSGHPGMAVLMVGGALNKIGLSLENSLRWAIALIVSVSLAGTTTLMYVLKPNILWWLAGGAVLLLHPLFVAASPTNAVTAAVLSFVFLLTYLIRERRPMNLHAYVILGVAVGIALATRLPTTVLLTGPIAMLLWHRVGWGKILLAVVVASIIFFTLDPLLWVMPAEHLQHIFARTKLHTTELGVASMGLDELFLFVPLSLLSIMSALIWLLNRKIPMPMSRSFAVFMIFLTLMVSTILLTAQSQSTRYFLPLVFFWEAVLPLWVLTLASRVRHAQVVSVAIVGLFIAGQLILLGNVLI